MKSRIHISYFLLTVSIIMLIASVFPHHHHQESLCMQSDVIETIYSCENATSCSHNHAADEKACGEDAASTPCKSCCITVFHLAQVEDSNDSMEPLYSLETILFTLTNFFELSLLEDENQVGYSNYYHETLHSICCEGDLALRGPPCHIA